MTDQPRQQLSEPVTIAAARLDPASRQYLQEVDASSPEVLPHGVLVRRPAALFDGPRGGWWLFLLPGLAAFAAAAFLYRLLLQEWADVGQLGRYQAILAAVGLFLLATGVTRFLRPRNAALFHSFLFADGLHLWDVTPDAVRATPLTDLSEAGGQHRYHNGLYTSSSLVLRFPRKNITLSLANQAAAESLLHFLQNLVALRRSVKEQWNQAAAPSPGWLGAVACQVVRQGWGGALPSVAPDLPTPYPVPPDPAFYHGGWRGAAVRGAAAAAVGAALFFLAPAFNSLILDEHLFAQTSAAGAGNMQPLDHYLAVFPEGRHAAAVRALRDDRRFRQAELEANTRNSPSGLRAYLADPTNERHREAAQRLIVSHYDLAIDGLKKKRDTDPAKIDRDLFEGVLALLEALKQTDRPVVTVGFKAILDAEPNEEQKAAEGRTYDFHLKKTPELKAIADGRPDRSAVVSVGSVFDAEQTARREEVILGRLRETVRQGINADLLTLQGVAAGQAPVMEVTYHIHPRGLLTLYTNGPEKRPVGLLREYQIDWTITIRPPGAKRVHLYRVNSEPGQELTYDMRPNDPTWGIYAVLLYSCFHDMSGRLIRNFGLDPGPAPNSFTFDAVAQTRAAPVPPAVPPFVPPIQPPVWTPKWEGNGLPPWEGAKITIRQRPPSGQLGTGRDRKKD